MKIHCKNTSPADRVDFSSRSQEVADILSSFEQIADTRDNRVQKIKKSIEAGTYTVQPRKLAELILKSINNTDNIKAILTEQVAGYRMLLKLLQRERASLLRFEPNRMEALTEEKYALMMKLKLLQNERIRLVRAFAEEHEISDTAVFSKSTQITGDDSFQRLRLQLISLLQSIMELNGFNRVLIERSAVMVQNALNFLGAIGVAVQMKNPGMLFSREA